MTFPYIISLIFSIIIAAFLLKTIAVAIWKKIKENENLKYEFITIIAHKFRTPLTQMKWLSETLITEEKDSYKKESLENIHHSTQQLIDLTGTLVELTDSDNASRNSYNFERINVCEMVKNVADTFKNIFHEKNIFLSLQCAAPNIFVNIDKPRIEFVLQTVLQNAVTYSPPGRNVEVVVFTEKHKAKITIKDHGIGIDSKDIPKIFTKFFRTANAQKTDTEGFGIGLYLAQAIIRRHKGKISVFSAGIDMGTTFEISLPAIK